MEIDDVPIIGKIHRTMNMMILNFILLGIICIILGVVIPFFPQVLDFLIAALLLVSAVILFHIAYNIHVSKKKYFKWFEKK